jgi:hypothetical protein
MFSIESSLSLLAATPKILIQSEKASLSLVDERVNGFVRDSLSIHPRFKALFEFSRYLFGAPLFIDQLFHDIATELFIILKDTFAFLAFSLFCILLGFLRSIRSITTGVSLELPDDHGVVTVEHATNVSQTVMTTKMEFDLFSFIHGKWLASHMD